MKAKQWFKDKGVCKTKKSSLKKPEHKKNGYHTATTAYPCSIPGLGEFSRSWLYPSATKVWWI